MSLTRREFLAGVTAGATLLPLSHLSAAPRKANRTLGIAFAGLGYYATQELAPAVEDSEFLRVTGVITGTPSKGDRWAKKYGLPASSVYSYDTMDRLADNREIDIVYVVTPPGLHREHVERAARAGKHVICEKPMATSVADCEAMIQACRKAGVQLAIGYRLHFDPYHQELMRLAQPGQWGPFRHIRSGHGFRISGKSWRLNKQLAGGGPLPDVGIYVIQGACMAAQAAPVSVVAKERSKTRPELFEQVEEAMDFTLTFPDGSEAIGFTSYGESVNYLRAESPKGWIELAPAYSYRGLEGRTSGEKLSFPPLRQQQRHLDAIARALLEKKPVPTPGEMGRRDLAVIEAIYRAAGSGNRETLQS